MLITVVRIRRCIKMLTGRMLRKLTSRGAQNPDIINATTLAARMNTIYPSTRGDSTTRKTRVKEPRSPGDRNVNLYSNVEE